MHKSFTTCGSQYSWTTVIENPSNVKEIWRDMESQGFFSAFWEHDPTPRIGNFRVVLYKIGKKHTL